MAKVYTAQEMREAADFFVRNAEMVRRKVLSNAILANIHEVIPMLRQAADAKEREEKRRDKKYEYEVHYTVNGKVFHSTGRAHSPKAAKCILTMYKGYKDAKIVRREIVEWEEVSEECK